MALLFLAPYSSGSRKRSLGSGARTRHERTTFPSVPWLHDELGRHDAGHLLDATSQTYKVGSSVQCPIVVKVSAGAHYDGPLTKWSREERYLWLLHMRPLDAFSLRIHSAVCVTPHAHVGAGTRRRLELWAPRTAVTVGDAMMRRAGQPAPLTQPQVFSALGISASEWEHFLQRPTCMLVPSHVLFLISKGSWHALMGRAQWVTARGAAALPAKRLQQSLQFPALTWARRLVESGRVRSFSQREPEPLTPACASDIAERLKKFATAVVEATSEAQDRAVITMELEQIVRRLDEHADMDFSWGRPTRKWDPHALLQAFSASMNLRNRGKLAKTICRALAGFSCSPQLASLDLSKLKFPSATTLGRKQVIIDAALCCKWAADLQRHSGAAAAAAAAVAAAAATAAEAAAATTAAAAAAAAAAAVAADSQARRTHIRLRRLIAAGWR